MSQDKNLIAIFLAILAAALYASGIHKVRHLAFAGVVLIYQCLSLILRYCLIHAAKMRINECKGTTIPRNCINTIFGG